MAKEKRDAGLIQVKLRMPIAVHRKLMREADRRGQTLNAEILARIAQSFEPEPSLSAIKAALAEELAKVYRGQVDDKIRYKVKREKADTETDND
jgi:hypothetical protein